MFKKLCMLAVLASAGTAVFAQEIPSETPKKIEHSVGLQANQLFRQLINLNNSNALIDNPFLFKYMLHPVGKTWELQAAFGFNRSSSKDEDAKKTELNELAFRVGVFKKRSVGKRFEVGYGIDIVLKQNYNRSETKDELIQGSFFSRTVFTETTSKLLSYGFGPQLNLTYAITDHVLLGTEATYYFLTGKNSLSVVQRTIEISNGFRSEDVQDESEENKVSSLTLTTPIALYLIVKL